MKQLYLFIALVISIQYSNAQYTHDSIKIDNGHLHYYTKGEGEPILLLQGGPGYSSYYMRAIADSLTNYRSILIDFEGTGRSQYRKANQDWVSINNMLSNIEQVRQKLNIDSWAIIGHSFGGMLALFYAVNLPDYVDKIISIGGVSTDNKFQEYFEDNLNRKLSNEEIIQINTILSSDLPMNEKMSQYQIALTPAYFYDRYKAFELLNSFPAKELQILFNPLLFNAYTSRSDFKTFDISKQVYELDTPINIIHGRQDSLGEEIPILLNERSKNSKLVFIEKCGHFPWAEQQDEFFQTLFAFLQDN